jgi:hypothetical protein
MNTFNVSNLKASEIKALVALWKKSKEKRVAIITHGHLLCDNVVINHRQIKKLKSLGLVNVKNDLLITSQVGLNIGKNFEFKHIIGND